MAGPMGQRAMELLASYRKYPNRPVQTLALGAPEFYADDAQSSRRSCRKSFTRWPGTNSHPPGGIRAGSGHAARPQRKGT